MIGQLNSLIYLIPIVREYQDSEDRGNSSYNHIGCGCIFALISIIAGSFSIYLYWLYLVSFLYHVVIIEVIYDTWWKKKNSKTTVTITNKLVPNKDNFGYSFSKEFKDTIDWPKVWSQCFERGCGFAVFLPLLIWRIL